MNILDTTIRDGSYAVDFKFSLDDVKDLVHKSSRLGIKYIEIGHGQGLNASSPIRGVSLHTDSEYIRAAKEVSGNSLIGAFCIPGIARIEDLSVAKDMGLDFVRIGINSGQYREASGFVNHAKEIGLFVTVNFMKSYILRPDEFASEAKSAYNDGADVAYIVDSAGSMMPDSISEYLDEIRNKSDINIGFHGHNNLGLAVSNTVFCAMNGVDFIDVSYQGIGRSCGNASLEQVIMILMKNGLISNFDIPCVLEYGYSGLKDILTDRITNPLDYICGYAGFHSGYIKDIYRCSVEKKVDPMRLILAYSEIDRRDMDYKKLYEVADALPIDSDNNPYSFRRFFSEII